MGDGGGGICGGWSCVGGGCLGMVVVGVGGGASGR